MGSSFFSLRPIESLHPGNWVFGHDGFPHRILNVFTREYRGDMIGARIYPHEAILWMTADHYILCAKRTTGYGAGCSWKHVPITHFERARDMRREMTLAEKVLWKGLRTNQLGTKFRRQHPIGPYIADFYSWPAGLVVEVDGDSHFSSEGEAYDQERTRYLESLGLTVLRFTNIDVIQNLPAVIETVLYASTAVISSESHYREWRRADSLRLGEVVYRASADSDTSDDKNSRTAAGTNPLRSVTTLEEGATQLPPVDGGTEGGLAVDGGTEATRFTLIPAEICGLVTEHTHEPVYDLEVEGSHSFVTQVCAVRSCRGGTNVVERPPFLARKPS